MKTQARLEKTYSPVTACEQLWSRTTMTDMNDTLRKLDRIAAFSEDFMKKVRGKKFRNPSTGNMVKFVSLPKEEQKKIYQALSASPQQSKKDVEPAEAEYVTRDDEDFLDMCKYFEEDAHAWKTLAKGKRPSAKSYDKAIERMEEAARHFPGAGYRGDYYRKGLATLRHLREQDHGKSKKAFAPMVSEESAVLLPAEVKNLSAERLRELGRSLMIAGTRPPRAQMVSIAVTLDGLLEQMKMLGEQSASLDALRRRVLLGLRAKVLGG